MNEEGKQLCKRQNDDAMYVSGTCDVSIVGSKIRMESIPENGKKKCSGGLEVCELAFTGSKKSTYERSFISCGEGGRSTCGYVGSVFQNIKVWEI